MYTKLDRGLLEKFGPSSINYLLSSNNLKTFFYIYE